MNRKISNETQEKIIVEFLKTNKEKLSQGMMARHLHTELGYTTINATKMFLSRKMNELFERGIVSFDLVKPERGSKYSKVWRLNERNII
jgi:hypothetical protein